MSLGTAETTELTEQERDYLETLNNNVDMVTMSDLFSSDEEAQDSLYSSLEEFFLAMSGLKLDTKTQTAVLLLIARNGRELDGTRYTVPQNVFEDMKTLEDRTNDDGEVEVDKTKNRHSGRHNIASNIYEDPETIEKDPVLWEIAEKTLTAVRAKNFQRYILRQ